MRITKTGHGTFLIFMGNVHIQFDEHKETKSSVDLYYKNGFIASLFDDAKEEFLALQEEGK